MRSRKSKDRQSNGQSTKQTKGQEKFEKAKGTIRNRKLKNRQCNGQTKKDKRYKILYRRLKIEQHKHYKNRGRSQVLRKGKQCLPH
jgi:hypothetical protein